MDTLTEDELTETRLRLVRGLHTASNVLRFFLILTVIFVVLLILSQVAGGGAAEFLIAIERGLPGAGLAFGLWVAALLLDAVAEILAALTSISKELTQRREEVLHL